MKTRRKAGTWLSDAEKQLIIQKYRDGVSVYKLVEEFGCGKTTIYNLLDLGLAVVKPLPCRPVEGEAERVAVMREAGLSWASIALKEGVAESTLYARNRGVALNALAVHAATSVTSVGGTDIGLYFRRAYARSAGIELNQVPQGADIFRTIAGLMARVDSMDEILAEAQASMAVSVIQEKVRNRTLTQDEVRGNPAAVLAALFGSVSVR